MHGLSATLSKIIATATRMGLRAERTNVDPPWLEVVGVPFRWGGLDMLGPIDAGTTIIQEIRTDLKQIDRIELLLGTYVRWNSSVNEVSLLDASGAIICRETFSSRSVANNQFRAVVRPRVPKPSSSDRLFLVIRSPNGSRHSGIGVWRSRNGAGCLWLGSQIGDRDIEECLRGRTRTTGSSGCPGVSCIALSGVERRPRRAIGNRPGPRTLKPAKRHLEQWLWGTAGPPPHRRRLRRA